MGENLAVTLEPEGMAGAALKASRREVFRGMLAAGVALAGVRPARAADV